MDVERQSLTRFSQRSQQNHIKFLVSNFNNPYTDHVNFNGSQRKQIFTERLVVERCFDTASRALLHESWIDPSLPDPDNNCHRTDGPAYTMYDPETGKPIVEEWMIHGRLSRPDGPARVYYDEEGTGALSCEMFYHCGELHRADGPAVVHYDLSTGDTISSEWYAMGKKISPQPALPPDTEPR